MSRDDYIEVHVRLKTFLERYPTGSLQSEWGWTESNGEKVLWVKAYAYRDPEDTRPGIGHAWEPVPGRTPYTRGSELMVGETSAWGRAMAALGIEVHKGIASAQEVKAAESRRIERTKPNAADDDPWNTPPTSKPVQQARRASAKQLSYIGALCTQIGLTDRDQRLMMVNACLEAKQLGSVTSSTELTDAQARAVIDGIKESMTPEQAAQELTGRINRAMNRGEG